VKTDGHVSDVTVKNEILRISPTTGSGVSRESNRLEVCNSLKCIRFNE